MATITAVGAYGHYTFSLIVNETDVNPDSNQSTVSWQFTIKGDEGYSFQIIGGTLKIVIDGEEVFNEYKQRDYTSGKTDIWASGSKTITHDSEGKKTISFSFDYSQSSTAYYTPGNASANGSMKLTDIALTNANIKIGNVWKAAKSFIKINGVWKKATPYIKVNGSWKKSK